MLKKMKFALLLMAFSTIIYSCGGDENKDGKDDNTGKPDTTKVTENKDNTPEKTVEDVPAVCVWNKLSVRETPGAKGKYKTTIYLGEKVTYKGETVKDTSSKKGVEYLKIELADGTIGWADKRFLAVNSNSFVFVQGSKVYKRPDILTATSKKFDKMQFVAVTETKDEWSKIKGIAAGDKWFSEGWVKTDNLTDSEIDVSVAILAQRALQGSDKDKKIKALNEIVDNADLKASIFIDNIKETIGNLNEINDESEGDELDE